MATLYKKPIVRTDPKTGEKVKTKSKKWWGQYKDASGKLCRHPLSVDKRAAQAMLNEIVARIEREKAGIVDPTDAQRKRPFSEHLADFKAYLQNKGVTEKQTGEATRQIEKMAEASKWKMISDITATGALEFLGELRRQGRSAQTYNHYLKSAKQFTRWLVRDRRTHTDPLTHLSKLNVSTDRRHDRRALSDDEFTRLIEAARNGKTIEGISGIDRAMMYLVAAWTGFRKGEIGSLTLTSLDLDGDPPTATVEASFSKRRRKDTQVLHPELAAQLKTWIATKDIGNDEPLIPISGRVPGGKERKTYVMIRRDLEAARKAWLKEAEEDEKELERREKSDFLCYRNHAGLYADFHSCRHRFVTSLVKAGVGPKITQSLARHSDVRLTLGVYAHTDMDEQAVAISALAAPPSENKKLRGVG